MAIDAERQAWNTAAIAGASLDAVVSIAPTSVLLLTGYWPVMGNSIAVFTRSGECRVILPEDEVEFARSSTAASLQPYSPGLLDRLTAPPQEFAVPLAAAMEQLGLKHARVGLELSQTMQPASYASSSRYNGDLRRVLEERLPDISFTSSDELIATLAARKSATELALMRRAAAIAGSGFAAAPAAIEPGASEPGVVASVYSAFECSHEAANVQRSYGFFYCMSGPNSAKASAAFAHTSRRTIENRDLVLVHANTCADGYWTDITRTYTAGEATDRQQKMREAIANARQAALDAIRPGARASDVDRAAREVMSEHGFGKAFRHSTGHGVGFAAANPNGRPRIHPASPDVLEEGMTFNVEPAAYFDGYGGMRHCDVVAVTATGVEVLTDF